MSSRQLNLVVAACSNGGIGANGTLPWRLRGDMAFFKKITSETQDAGKQNAVIMGRKTWASIPEKFRPLAKRLNVVISTTMNEAPEGTHISKSFEEAVHLVSTPPLAAKVERIFIIGGSSVYKMAMESEDCHRVYLTRVMADFDCDTFLPNIDENKFKMIESTEVDNRIQKDNDIEYKFEVYEKKMRDTRVPFYIMAAMLDNRGIGQEGHIAWPPIRKDYEHYITMTSTPRHQGKKCVYIKGRVTWAETCEDEKANRNVINIVISNRECSLEHLHYKARDFEHAVQIATSPPVSDVADSVWVMGGQQVYQSALDWGRCERLYLTRIHCSYPSDTFFPQFEHCFKQIRDPNVHIGLQEENGTSFEFKVYENTRGHLKTKK